MLNRTANSPGCSFIEDLVFEKRPYKQLVHELKLTGFFRLVQQMQHKAGRYL